MRTDRVRHRDAARETVNARVVADRRNRPSRRLGALTVPQRHRCSGCAGQDAAHAPFSDQKDLMDDEEIGRRQVRVSDLRNCRGCGHGDLRHRDDQERWRRVVVRDRDFILRGRQHRDTDDRRTASRSNHSRARGRTSGRVTTGSAVVTVRRFRRPLRPVRPVTGGALARCLGGWIRLQATAARRGSEPELVVAVRADAARPRETPRDGERHKRPEHESIQSCAATKHRMAR